MQLRGGIVNKNSTEHIIFKAQSRIDIMNKKILFYLDKTDYGSMKFYRLAKSLNKLKYKNHITPVILTPSKEIAKMAEIDKIETTFFKPFFKYLKRIRYIKLFPVFIFCRDLVLFALYKKELSSIVYATNPSWIILASDSSYNENIILANMGTKSLVVQFTMDSLCVPELVNYMQCWENRRKFSCTKWIVDRLLRISRDYNCRFSTLKGPYKGSALQHTVLKLHKILPQGERKGCGNSTRVALNGKAYQEIFIEYGVSKSKLVVTGNPEDDKTRSLLSQKDKIKEKVKNYFGSNVELVTVFLQSLDKWPCYEKYDYISCIKMILKVMQKHKSNVTIIVKCHPKTIEEKYKFLDNEFGCRTIGENTGITNEELILSSKFVITMTSTVGFHSFALGVPLISFNFGMQVPDHLKHTGGTIHCESISEIELAIDELMKENNSLRSKAIKNGENAAKKVMMLDGKCTDRIFEIVRQ